MTTLDSALSLRRLGLCVIPVIANDKFPVIDKWQELRITAEQIPDYFRDGHNIGVHMGEPSKGVVDVDLDHPMAVAFADECLPTTGSIFGRTSKPRSHWLYLCPGAKTRKWQLPAAFAKHCGCAAMVAELRATGAQTVFPGSTHPSGEEIRWDVYTAPAKIAYDELCAQLQALYERVYEALMLAHPGWEPPAPKPAVTRPITTSGDRYALAALKKECDIVAGCADGTGNDTVFTAGLKMGGLIAAGVLDENEVYRCLTDALSGWTWREPRDRDKMLRSMRGGVEAGKSKPRQLPERSENGVSNAHRVSGLGGSDNRRDGGGGDRVDGDDLGDPVGEGGARGRGVVPVAVSAAGVGGISGSEIRASGVHPNPGSEGVTHGGKDRPALPGTPAGGGAGGGCVGGPEEFFPTENLKLPALYYFGGATAQMVNFAATHIGSHENVYCRAGGLNKIVHPPGKIAEIWPLKVHCIRDALSETVRVYKQHPQKKSEWKYCPAPDQLANSVLTLGSYPTVRPIKGVVTFPILRPDGSILTDTGYDHTSQFYYSAAGKIELQIKPDTTREEAEAYADQLLDLVADFPFAGASSKTAWVAALLTPLARTVFRGPAPLFLCNANSLATGKTMLMSVAHMIVMGIDLNVSTWSDDPEEQRKALTTSFVNGKPIYVLDNIKKLQSKNLEMALTGTDWNDRLLGSNSEVSIPINTTLWATGNNVGLLGDIARRVLPIKIQTALVDPSSRTGFRYPNIVTYALDHRQKYLSAAYGILSGYLAAGRPTVPLLPYGSYEGWSGVVRSACVWAGLIDPLVGKEEVTEQNNDAAQSLECLAAAWYNKYGSNPRVLANVIEDCERTSEFEDFTDLNRAVRDALDLGNRDSILHKHLVRFMQSSNSKPVCGPEGKTLMFVPGPKQGATRQGSWICQSIINR